jgi:hypothetical protein
MGIQVYIYTKALESKGIEVKFHNEEHTVFCSCGCCEGGWCDCCGERTYDTYRTYVEIESLPLMHTLGENIVWHDANHWGSSREPIMAFITKHNLIEEDEWYEA